VAVGADQQRTGDADVGGGGQGERVAAAQEDRVVGRASDGERVGQGGEGGGRGQPVVRIAARRRHVVGRPGHRADRDGRGGRPGGARQILHGRRHPVGAGIVEHVRDGEPGRRLVGARAVVEVPGPVRCHVVARGGPTAGRRAGPGEPGGRRGVEEHRAGRRAGRARDGDDRRDGVPRGARVAAGGGDGRHG